MISALSSLYALASSGMVANARRLDVIADNMANSTTTGFKAALVQFGEALSDPATRQVTDPARGGQGTLILSTMPSLAQGALQPADSPWHLAIDGPGFFRVQLPDGSMAYTRDGRFRLDEDGRLITSDGYLVMPNITLPEGAEHFAVNADGSILVWSPVDAEGDPTATEVREIGRLTLAGFPNPEGLQRIGHNLYASTDASGDSLVSEPGLQGLGEIVGRALESSNVSLIDEMADLMAARRAYAVAARLLTTVDDMGRLADELIT